MRTIQLTQGKHALVDDRDHAWLSQWNWHARKRVLKGRTIWYAARCAWDNARQQVRSVLMHWAILGTKGVDHRDGDGLNNQRENLRPASAQQNAANRRKPIGGSSCFKGVSWHARQQKWIARIGFRNRVFQLGSFVRPRDAAIAYDSAARFLFGEFARTNLNINLGSFHLFL